MLEDCGHNHTETVTQPKLESTQRVQTSAEDFCVLFLADYRNRNKESFNCDPDRRKNLIDWAVAPPLQKFHQNPFITF